MVSIDFSHWGYSVKVKTKSIVKVTSLLLIGFLFFTPISMLPCQKAGASRNPCCCCQKSSPSPQSDDAEKDDCSCKINKTQPAESSVAVSLSPHDGKPKVFPVASEAEVKTEDHLVELSGFSPSLSPLPCRDRPLYLLHSIYLI